jgi:hypothetical protein
MFALGKTLTILSGEAGPSYTAGAATASQIMVVLASQRDYDGLRSGQYNGFVIGITI